MKSFWKNLNRFPRFFISTIIGFFLTTFTPIIKLLKNKNKRYFLTILLLLIIAFLSKTIELMLDI
uniref:Uncharacterized protein ycf33 n=1 Tax=Gastroclonium compressum TaxID=1852973 RepID=A0A173G089_GASCM|nr:conserved hypothetical plastid protein Ycf33 [Coeloseira compressa]ANH09693.1 conserved hypothetical plastid protein Ycf33 [Coeloseira compressa]